MLGDFLREHQLNIMLVLIGVTGIIAVFVLITKLLSTRRKWILFSMEICAMLLLVFDRFAYIYRGDISRTGYFMVRISNFMVFALSILIIGVFNLYLIDLLEHEGALTSAPKRLVFLQYLLVVGIGLILFSQFTGFYYTFDESNRYVRAPGFIICYIIPIIGLVVQLWVILQYGRNLGKRIYFSIFLFAVVPLVASIVQYFSYGLSLSNVASVGMAILLYIFALININETADKVHKQELDYLEESKESMRRLFEQTVKAFMNALDNKDEYMRGHSERVADYSRQIASLSGMDEAKVDEVYFAALLHDVGKLGIPDYIISKEGRLSSEENSIFMGHTEIGNSMLQSIREYPFLNDGAHYHHERYDGEGYPEGLKGDKIPEVARIIAVADAYDNMTSNRSYRGALPQTRVREEFVKEAGARFDPEFAKIMLSMIDADSNYSMKGTGEGHDNALKRQLVIDEYRTDLSCGILINQNERIITLKVKPKKSSEGDFVAPALILFDSLDGLIHSSDIGIKNNTFIEYGEVFFDGHIVCTKARNMDVRFSDPESSAALQSSDTDETLYEIRAERYRDHVRLKISGGEKDITVVAALYDSTRYTYISLTGEHCIIDDIEVADTGVTVKEGDIPRIADEISYIDRMEADIPNIQIESNRAISTVGIPVKNGMKLRFHSMSLPSSHFVWNCPYLVLFSALDGKVKGPDYKEYVLIRLNGEIEEDYNYAENKLTLDKNRKFENWDKWRENNHKGMECEVLFMRKGNKITSVMENSGIEMKVETKVKSGGDAVYVALTGDRCAITDIRVIEPN